ncbi:carboxymuconolactone decarboxylase family protein [Amylibacter sp.]|nr:carboxymuconolactone decarboxylase family protein [Amylibacter sp.]
MTPERLFAPIKENEWPSEIDDMKSSFADKLNVYRSMAHHPNLLRAWADLREHIVVNSALSQQQSEVVILRTGNNLQVDYEWYHHVSRARACGMNDHRINSMKLVTENMNTEDAIFADAVDEIMEKKKITPNTLKNLYSLVGKEGVLDTIATVGFYSTLGFMINSFNTPIDDDIINEMIKQPISEENL